MAKRRWTKDEIEQWQKEHQGFGYCNKQDSNIIVSKRYGIGFTFNWGNPLSWVIMIALIAAVVIAKAIS
jgi:uncharacterized membrane protein